MATDHDGNTINVGDNVWLPASIVGINATTGVLTLTPSFGGSNVQVPADKVHRPRTFPDAP